MEQRQPNQSLLKSKGSDGQKYSTSTDGGMASRPVVFCKPTGSIITKQPAVSEKTQKRLKKTLDKRR
tara:strand:- start:270 stop:470 length:201 start_codon:yes stop_codon:yes gene_type:complete